MRLLQARGETLWSGPEDGGRGRAAAAIRFQEIDETSRKLIDKIVDNGMREGIEPFRLKDVSAPPAPSHRGLTVPAEESSPAPMAPSTTIDGSVFDLSPPPAAPQDDLFSAPPAAGPGWESSAEGEVRSRPHEPVPPVPLLADPEPAPFDLEMAPRAGGSQPAAAAQPALDDLFADDQPVEAPPDGRTEAFPPGFVDEVEAELVSEDEPQRPASTAVERSEDERVAPQAPRDEVTPAALPPVEATALGSLVVDVPAAGEPEARETTTAGVREAPEPVQPLELEREPEPEPGLELEADLEIAPRGVIEPIVEEPPEAQPPDVEPAPPSEPPPVEEAPIDQGLSAKTVELPLMSDASEGEALPSGLLSSAAAQEPAAAAPMAPPIGAVPEPAVRAPEPEPEVREPEAEPEVREPEPEVSPQKPEVGETVVTPVDSAPTVEPPAQESEPVAPAADPGALEDNLLAIPELQPPPVEIPDAVDELSTSAESLRGVASSSRRMGTWFLIVLLMVALAVAGYFLMDLLRGGDTAEGPGLQTEERPPVVATTPAAEEAAEPMVDPAAAGAEETTAGEGDAAVPSAEHSADPSDAEETTDDAAAEATSADPAAPEPEAPAATEAGPETSEAPAGAPFTGLDRITWEERGSDTVLVLIGDGEIRRQQIEVGSIGGAQPRLVIKIDDVRRPLQPAVMTVGTAQVQRVRSGLQTTGALHVVVDLRLGGVKVRELTTDGSRVEVRLGVE
jgi:hypothetical protein